MPDRPPRIIALMNQKGGVGKTTTTVSLASALAKAGRDTLVVDLDPQAHATLHLGVDPETAGEGAYDILLDPTMPMREAVREVAPHLALCPARTDLAAAELELANVPQRQRRLEQAIAGLGGAYEFILLDCPPSLGLLTINALTAAREVIIPIQAHFLALQGVGKLLETVRLVASAHNPRLRVTGVILCMHDPSSTHTREVVADLDAFFDAARGGPTPWKFARVLRPPVRRNIKLAECPSFGKSIFDYAPDAPAAADYKALADLLRREWDAHHAAESHAAEPTAPPAPEVTIVRAREQAT